MTLSYQANSAIYTGDVIQMRVDNTGIPSVWVAGVSTSWSAKEFVYRYYGVNSWGTVLWIDGVGRFRAEGFSGNPFTLGSNVPEEITSGSTVIGGRLISTFDLG